LRLIGMTEAHPKRLFASYARGDARHVHLLVKLVRASGAPVFLDTDSIPPGTKWREALAEAISNASAVVVFWSARAAKSREVEDEYEEGIRLAKTIIPVCLDDAPLPSALSPYQALGLQELFVPHDPSFDATRLLKQLVSRLLAG
jgi:hypothetical protein